MFKVYKPKQWIVLMDVFFILLNIFVVLAFFPLTSQTPFVKYSIPSIFFIGVWILVSYLFGRYKTLSTQSFFRSVFHLFYTAIVVVALFAGFIIIQPRSPFSQNVLVSVMVGLFMAEYLFLLIYFTVRYAVSYDVTPSVPIEREGAHPLPSRELTAEEKNELRQQITAFAGEKMFNYLERNHFLNDTSTRILTDNKEEELGSIEPYLYSTFIQLKHLNNIRGLNQMFSVINDKLPDNGVLICCFYSQSTIKKKIFAKYPAFISFCIYCLHYLMHRVVPKILITHRLYYDLTEGKKRILSRTEVLGRLYFNGYEVLKQTKINGVNLIVVRRVKQPENIRIRTYGPLIKLRRKGKDGKFFSVYKMRTMHPYSEFLQEYVYEKNNLEEGGKFKRDIRVTTLGKIMRKYWLDELPMFINLLKGDMKLVGVRPLSNQYFSLYTKELQEKRIKYKPGLLPPFYADMPKTMDEIQASEMKYLSECENKGVFITDTKYFFLILRNILFKKARSA